MTFRSSHSIRMSEWVSVFVHVVCVPNNGIGYCITLEICDNIRQQCHFSADSFVRHLHWRMLKDTACNEGNRIDIPRYCIPGTTWQRAKTAHLVGQKCIFIRQHILYKSDGMTMSTVSIHLPRCFELNWIHRKLNFFMYTLCKSSMYVYVILVRPFSSTIFQS